MYVTMVKCVPARADCPINKLEAERQQPRTYRDVFLFIRYQKKEKATTKRSRRTEEESEREIERELLVLTVHRYARSSWGMS